jgi:hypothetical protein
MLEEGDGTRRTGDCDEFLTLKGLEKMKTIESFLEDTFGITYVIGAITTAIIGLILGICAFTLGFLQSPEASDLTSRGIMRALPTAILKSPFLLFTCLLAGAIQLSVGFAAKHQNWVIIALSNPFIALFGTSIASYLYKLRCRKPLYYGAIEWIVGGLSLINLGATEVAPGQLGTRVFAILGSIYIVVRGYDNLNRVFYHTNPLWRRTFWGKSATPS